MSKSVIGFSVYLSGKLINEVKFDRPIINVGKLSTSTLRIDDVNVSRKHAVIEQREDGRWRVTDLGSTNGTVLRGERVVQAEINDGDRLVLGTTTLLVQLAAVAAHAQVVAGTAGDTRQVAMPPLPLAAAPSEPVGPVGLEEIRGLGEASFYKKRGATEGATWVLDVALLWGETVLASRAFMKAQDITLGEGGEDEGVDFAIPREVLGSDRFTLVHGSDAGFAFDLSNPNVTGDVLLGDKVRGVAELVGESDALPIRGALRARFKVGEFTLLVAHSPLVRSAKAKRTMDKDVPLFVGLSALVQIAFLIIASTAPADLLMTSRDPRAARQRVVEALKITPMQLAEEQKQDKAKEEDIRKDNERRETEAELVVDLNSIPVEEPTTAKPEEARPLVDKMSRPRKSEDLTKLSPEQRHAKAAELAQQTAMSQAFKANNPLFDKLMTDLESQPSPFKALGPTDPSGATNWADEGGNVNPFSGFNASDSAFLPSDGGPPPGTPDGPVIADGLKKRPPTDIKDPDFTKPEGGIRELPPRISGGELDAATVQRLIRRQLSGIKWCYQDALQANHDLGGKGTLAFSIMPSGATHGAHVSNSTLNDGALEACMATKMSRWRFPAPPNGGVVEVEYPIILKAK